MCHFRQHRAAGMATCEVIRSVQALHVSYRVQHMRAAYPGLLRVRASGHCRAVVTVFRRVSPGCFHMKQSCHACLHQAGDDTCSRLLHVHATWQGRLARFMLRVILTLAIICPTNPRCPPLWWCAAHRTAASAALQQWGLWSACLGACSLS